MLEIAGKLFRVQVKYATQRGGVIRVNLECTYYSPRGYVRSTYSADEVDLIAVYCSEVDEAFLLPIAASHRRVGSKALPRASYLLTVTARDAAGNRSTAATATFKVVAAPRRAR